MGLLTRCTLNHNKASQPRPRCGLDSLHSAPFVFRCAHFYTKGAPCKLPLLAALEGKNRCHA